MGGEANSRMAVKIGPVEVEGEVVQGAGKASLRMLPCARVYAWVEGRTMAEECAGWEGQLAWRAGAWAKTRGHGGGAP